MVKNDMIKIIEEMGFEAVTTDNGGISPHIGIVNPSFRPDDFKDTTEGEFRVILDEAIKDAKAKTFDVDSVFSEENLRKNLFICKAPRNRDNIYTYKFLDIDVAFLLAANDFAGEDYKAGIYITKYHISNLGMNVELLKRFADDNMYKHREFCSFFGMNIVKNSEIVNGALSGFNMKFLREYASEVNDDLYIIPSSISEVIIYEASRVPGDFEYMSNMVKEVNEAEVAEEERFADHAYKYCRAKDEIVFS